MSKGVKSKKNFSLTRKEDGALMDENGFLWLAREMLRRSGAKGIKVRFWDDKQETNITIRRRKDAKVGKRREV